MGRKGVSKRKPQQSKSKPFTADKAGGSPASAAPVESTRSTESGKVTSSGDLHKNQRKG